MISFSWNVVSGLIWGITAVVIWSGSLVLLRIGVASGMTVGDLTALRFGVGGVMLLPVLIRNVSLNGWPRLSSILLMTSLFGAPYVLLLSLAVKTAPAAAAGALNPGIMAISSVILSRLLYGQKLTKTCLMGIALTAFGILGFCWVAGGFTQGHFVLVITGIMWASYAAFIRIRKMPALQATTLITLGSAVVYLPVYALALPTNIIHAALADILLQALFQGVMVTVIAVYAFSRSVELLGQVAGTSLPALIPVVTLGLEILILGETPRFNEVAAATLVAFGIALVLIGTAIKRRAGDAGSGRTAGNH